MVGVMTSPRAKMGKSAFVWASIVSVCGGNSVTGWNKLSPVGNVSGDNPVGDVGASGGGEDNRIGQQPSRRDRNLALAYFASSS